MTAGRMPGPERGCEGNAGREFDRDVRVNVFGLKRSLVAPFDRMIDDDAIWSSRFDFVMVRTGTEAL
ncbi:hypothetical protein GQE99_01570 [Maritimibacter sp. DP07]|uniref:Uncharacterized protein n=1 Tax=Maritimibacter harenae TaxID=2606218 RepID=A0A845LY66_9RHOB|nr:hypothetical protein [Maritimibacter harenae]MZR11712.1 hypothetical protein [Maritimibacter harenae]